MPTLAGKRLIITLLGIAVFLTVKVAARAEQVFIGDLTDSCSALNPMVGASSGVVLRRSSSPCEPIGIATVDETQNPDVNFGPIYLSVAGDSIAGELKSFPLHAVTAANFVTVDSIELPFLRQHFESPPAANIAGGREIGDAVRITTAPAHTNFVIKWNNKRDLVTYRSSNFQFETLNNSDDNSSDSDEVALNIDGIAASGETADGARPASRTGPAGLLWLAAAVLGISAALGRRRIRSQLN